MLNLMQEAAQDERQSLLSSKGGVLELLCPDFAAHGIGTSLHLFPPEQVAATGLFQC